MIDFGIEGLFNKPPMDLTTVIKDWKCDWVTLNLMGDVNFVSDINMYKLYANAYNIDCDMLTDDELTELANMYKEPIHLFITQNIEYRLLSILKRWQMYCGNDNYRQLFRLPSQCKTLLTNMLSLHSASMDMESTPHISAFLSSIFAARAPRTTYTYDKPNTFESVSVVEYNNYCTILEHHLGRLFAHCVPGDFTPARFNDKYKRILEVFKSLLLMCVPGEDTAVEETLDIYNASIKPDMDVTDILNMIGDTTPAHAICITADNI